MKSTEPSVSGLTRTELEPLLTFEAVCRLLGVSKPTLYRIVRSGELPAIRVSQSPRFARDDIRAYLERHREGRAP